MKTTENEETDLFGDPWRAPIGAYKRKRGKETPKGYATRPGTGPKGEFCRTCRHAAKREKFWKCAVLRHRWTSSYGTDIRLKSPACALWGAKES